MSRRDDDFYRLAKARAAASSEALFRKLSGRKAAEEAGTGGKTPRTDRRTSEERRAYWREYHARNRERIAAYHREYYALNRERMNAYQREYHEKNREKVNERQRERYRKNSAKENARSRAYRERNRERIASYQREYSARRLATMRETLERRKAELVERDEFARWALSLSGEERAELVRVAGRNAKLMKTMTKEA